MHSDRELLELAARAAGLQLCGYSWVGENEDDEECEILESAFVKRHKEQGLATKWNPLTDDGDALRLADSLDFIVDFSRFSVIEADMFYLGHRDFVLGNNVNEAITRAAAKIGKEMK